MPEALTVAGGGVRTGRCAAEVAVLVVANALATLLRFIALRQMMHRRARR